MTALQTATAPLVILDYGAGNLASFEGALVRLELPFVRATSAAEVPEHGVLVLPGVGHFAAAKAALCERELWQVLKDQAKARGVLGICLGLQLLAEGSAEAPGAAGLGLLHGYAQRFVAPEKVPHMGWNEVHSHQQHRAFSQNTEWAYFVHSYALPVTADTASTCMYGTDFSACAARGRVLGMQHHPERSSGPGLASLARALRWLQFGTEPLAERPTE
jgi:imidazole glycerol-phosphate synthase subunit HisH